MFRTGRQCPECGATLRERVMPISRGAFVVRDECPECEWHGAETTEQEDV